ncbi:MAG: hydrogenase iron-sulfur subunit [Candidatus Aminicenantes bacterium]|nr:hydrogenase iron-sulfur subunit [Candidatus Aminicenantes bacterium]
MNRDPKIVAFLCHWCSYTGADLAGTSRVKYSPHVRIIRIMCSGRIDTAFVLKALREGADGVLICGCHPGDCHYQSGNDKALKRHIMLKQMIGQFGVEPERIRLEWISASEGDLFAKIVDNFTEQVKNLGPLNWKETMRPKSGEYHEQT